MPKMTDEEWRRRKEERLRNIQQQKKDYPYGCLDLGKVRVRDHLTYIHLCLPLCGHNLVMTLDDRDEPEREVVLLNVLSRDLAGLAEFIAALTARYNAEVRRANKEAAKIAALEQLDQP